MQSKDTLQMFRGIAFHFHIGDFLERQHLRVEVDRSIHVRDRDTYGVDSVTRAFDFGCWATATPQAEQTISKMTVSLRRT